MWEVLPQILGTHGLEPWTSSLNPTLPLCVIVKIVTVLEPSNDDHDDDVSRSMKGPFTSVITTLLMRKMPYFAVLHGSHYR